MPMTPFMGVRISWLMLARNSDFKMFACSACALAACNSCSLALDSVISSNTQMLPDFGALISMAVPEIFKHTRMPSLRGV